MDRGQVAANDKQQKMNKKEKNTAASDERKSFLKYERLKRESAIGTRNNERLRRSWIKIMTKIEIPTMKETIEVRRNIFDRTLDIKDHRVHSLVEYLNEAEMQYKRNIGGHVGIMGRLEEIYHHRSNEGYDRYKLELDEMIQESEADVDRIASMDNESEDFLQSIIIREERNCGELLDNVQSETTYKLDNLREDGNHSIKMALIDIESRVKFHWHVVNSLITNYSNDTQQRRLSHDVLKVKDTKDGEIISNQLSETDELFDTIHKYEEKIKKLENSSHDTTHNINIEKTMSWEAYSSMKQRFHNERTIDKAQVTHMTREFNLTVKNLARLVKKAQTALACIRICRKFESQMDKLLPAQLNRANRGLGNFKYFWHLVGVAELETMALREEKKLLEGERESLKKCIKFRISGEDD